MATTVRTGTTDASRRTIASACASYAGVRGAAARLGSGYLLIVGGKTVNGAGAETKINLPTLLRVTNTLTQPDGSVAYAYEWRRPDDAGIAAALNAHLEDTQAVALTDPGHAGKVLLCGGHLALAAASSTTTIFGHETSPEAFTTRTVGALAVARAMHRAVVLADHQVLVCGGWTAHPTALATAQRWNPATEAWAAAASMGTARFDHAAVRLADGRVLVCGGRTGASTLTPTAEVYDPAGNTWAPTGSMEYQRAGHALVPLPDGRVLAVGGEGRRATTQDAVAPLAAAEVWDPATNLWLPAGATEFARERPAAAYVAALGAVLVAGGQTTAIELWVAGTWRRSLASLPVVRREALLAALPGGPILLAGGAIHNGVAWQTTEASHFVTPGAELVGGGDATGLRRVTAVPSATQLRYQTDTRAAAAGAGGTVTPVAGPVGAGEGAFVVDPVDGLAVTGTEGVVATILEAGRGHTTLRLQATLSDPSPAARFPDTEGWLAFRFGRDGTVAPVRYLGRASAVDLRLDATSVFGGTVQLGDRVVLLADRGAPQAVPGNGNALVLTASNAGRVAASTLADEVVAGGIDLTRRVLYPGDRGLGGEGAPTAGAPRLSDIVAVYAGDDVTAEVDAAREEQ